MSFIFIPTSSGINGSNTYLGAGALQNSIGCEDWTAIGFGAAAILETGQGGVAIGSGALSNTLSNDFSVGIGYRALRSASGNRNIGIGPNAGEAITTGSSNVLIGGFDGAGIIANVQTGTNNIVLSDGSGNVRYAYLADIPAGVQDHVFRAGAGSGSEILRIRPAITGASTNALLDIAGTWNTTGAANGIRLNVTDTASAAGALLMDLRVGGVSALSVGKGGAIFFGAGSSNYIVRSGGAISIAASFGDRFFVDGTWGVAVTNGASFGFVGSGIAAPDVSLFRDAADTLAQRRGVNAQAFRIYNTFTDASNYERGYVRWSGNQFQIGPERAGTGLIRSVQIDAGAEVFIGNGTPAIFFSTNGNTRWRITGAGMLLPIADNLLDIGEASAKVRRMYMGEFVQMSEMTAPAAPAANNVVIYAVDNGSGKTQLMALFATGAAQQIAIEP